MRSVCKPLEPWSVREMSITSSYRQALARPEEIKMLVSSTFAPASLSLSCRLFLSRAFLLQVSSHSSGVVLSGVSLDIVRDGVGAPVLGVCLGMQALALANGADVVCGPEPVHGRLSSVSHTGHRLFDGIPSGQTRLLGAYTLRKMPCIVDMCSM